MVYREDPPALENVELDLPIYRCEQEIENALRGNDEIIIIGETGSGKTTRLPLILRKIIGSEDKMAITQPRRVAARSVARFVSGKVGCEIGKEVGYSVRFDDKTTEGTKINFMTDGILLRKMQNDPLLGEYSVIMVDEVHERSLNIDLILGLLKKVQVERRRAGLKPLKIIVASATLEKEKLAKHFNEAPIIEASGRTYPVEFHYADETPYDYTQAATERVQKIIQEDKKGDMLIFMPGKSEIDKTIEEIRRLGLSDVVVLPLYGDLSAEDQDRIFDRNDGKRKIIVATNIAETSITVPGVRYVIDSGLIKQTHFDPQTGIESLRIEPHAKSGCIQRAGRAGRESPGEYYFLGTLADFNSRRDFQLPEIQRSGLAHVVLAMKSMGIEDVEAFDFVDPPDKEALEQSIKTLIALGALNEEGKLTKVGEIMAELPLEPHIARMVIESQKLGCLQQVCTIAAFLGSRDVMVRPEGKESQADAAHKKFEDQSSDFLTFLKIWNEYERSGFGNEWARNNFLSSKTLAEVRDVRYQLFGVLAQHRIQISEKNDPDIIGRSIAAGLVENLLEASVRHSYTRVSDGVPGFFIHPSSTLFEFAPRYFVSARIVQTSKKFARICQEVKPEWIHDIAPQLVREQERNVFYDPPSGVVMRRVEFFLGRSYDAYHVKNVEVTGDEALSVFASALAMGKVDLPFRSVNNEVLKRIRDLYVRSGGITIPPLDIDRLADFYRSKLGSIDSLKKLEEALATKLIDLTINLNDYVSIADQQEIFRNNPDTVWIGNTEYELLYADNPWSSNRFSVRIRVPVKDVFKIFGLPQIPSGREISIEVIEKEGSSYSLFEGGDLELLKKEARSFLIKQQWQEWQVSQPSGVLQKKLIGFDLVDEYPPLPERLVYGSDPETGQTLYAYPAITINLSYREKTFFVQYYKTKEEADLAQAETEKMREEALMSKRKEAEKEQLLLLTRERTERLRQIIESIVDYKRLGLSDSGWAEVQNLFSQARAGLDRDPQGSQSILDRVEEIIGVSRDLDVAQQESLRQGYERILSRLHKVREDLASLTTRIYTRNQSYLPVGIVEARTQCQQLEESINQRRLSPDVAESLILKLEESVGRVDRELLEDYVETVSKRSQGSYIRVEIKNDQAFVVDSYGRRPVDTLVVGGLPGRPENIFRISQIRGGNLRLIPNGAWGEELTLSSGCYVIGKDGRFVYSVTFDDAGEIKEVLDKPVGESFGRRETDNGLGLVPALDQYLGQTTMADALVKAGFVVKRESPTPSSQPAEPSLSTRDRLRTVTSDVGEQGRREENSFLGQMSQRSTDDLVQEVRGLLSRDSKPLRRAVIEAVLLGRGPGVAAEIEISDAEFLNIINQLEIDIKTKKKQRELVGMNEMESALQGVKNMRLVIDASRKKYVRDLIGDNKDDSLRFQEILLSLIRERKELPQGDEVDSLITRTIEIMTS